MVKELGYVYSFTRENYGRPEALICTNSDRIEALTELVVALPKLHFHIAALTEMSPKLHEFESYENVSLYPSAKSSVLDKLFAKCDFYFDINHEGEIVDAVHRAFLNNMFIVGFEGGIHNRNYISSNHIYAAEQVNDMIAAVRQAMESKEMREKFLAEQKAAALAIAGEEFSDKIGLSF